MYKNGCASLFVFLSFSIINSTSHASDAVERLVVFGDSLAAGTMAKTNLGQYLTSPVFDNLVQSFEDYIRDPRQGGAALLREFYGPYSSVEETAFAGSREYSFSKKIEAVTHNTINVTPYAVPGATTKSMDAQVTKMQEDNERYGLPSANYIVVHIGGNDWCGLRPDADFRNDLTKRLTDIAIDNPDSKILVLPVPPMTKMLAMPDTAAFKTQVGGKDIAFSCGRVRFALQTCAARHIGLGASEESLEQHVADLQRFNAIVNNVTEKIRTSVKSFHGKIEVSRIYARGDFDPSWIAMDCFHPGKIGQEKIADLVWPDMEELIGKR